MEKLLTVREVAKLFQVCERTIREWLSLGIIEKVQIPGIRAVRFRESDILKLLKK